MNDCYYSNCDLYKNNEHCMDSIEFCEYSLREHDKQIRADAIEECIEAIEDTKCLFDNTTKWTMGQKNHLQNVLRKLKEQK